MRICADHGSLSDRILSWYGDTSLGMVESAMEFLRIARDENFHQIELSMKISNPLAMIHAYRLLVQTMKDEFGEYYPLHLGITEAGEGEDSLIKSVMGMGTLLEDGLGDTVNVSLTEEQEFELSLCRDLVQRFERYRNIKNPESPGYEPAYNPLSYERRPTHEIKNIGSKSHPVVIADFSETELNKKNLRSIGYLFQENNSKWISSDPAADYVYTSGKYLPFDPPRGLKVLCDAQVYGHVPDKNNYFPIFTAETWLQKLDPASKTLNFISIDCKRITDTDWKALLHEVNPTFVFCLFAGGNLATHTVRKKINDLWLKKLKIPVILGVESLDSTIDEQIIHFSCESGALLLEGMGDGLWLRNHPDLLSNPKISGCTYQEVNDNNRFINNTAFSILQASQTRIGKTE